MWFLPAPRNKNNWGDILARLRANVELWRDNYDIVLLDTPPMLATNDATDLLGVADSVVLVLRAGQTRSGPAEGVANLLGRFRADVLGIVLNGCSSAEMDYGYGYGYGYYGGDNSYFAETPERKRPSHQRQWATATEPATATGPRPSSTSSARRQRTDPTALPLQGGTNGSNGTPAGTGTNGSNRTPAVDGTNGTNGATTPTPPFPLPPRPVPGDPAAPSS